MAPVHMHSTHNTTKVNHTFTQLFHVHKHKGDTYSHTNTVHDFFFFSLLFAFFSLLLSFLSSPTLLMTF